MSRGLVGQLRDYGDILHAELAPVELDEILTESLIDVGLPTRVSGIRWRWVYGLLAAVLTLIVIGGVVLLVRPLDESAPVLTTPSTVPAEPRLSATVISGEADTVPIGPIVVTGDGFVGLESPYTSDGSSTLWRSGDGTDWHREPLPPGIESASTIEHNSWGYWLTQCCTPGDRSLWWSADTVSWREIPLEAVTLPNMTGIDWGVIPLGIYATDDTVVYRLQVFGDLIEPFHGDPAVSDLMPEWHPETRIVELVDSNDSGRVESRIQLTIETDGDQVQVRAVDADTGEEIRSFVGAIPGIDTEQLLAGVAVGQVAFDALLVSHDGESFETVEAPWGARSEIVARDGSYLAYSMNGPHPFGGTQAIEVWSSRDGTEWERLGSPSFSEEELNSLRIDERDGTLLALVHGSGDTQAILRSTDGLEWTPVSGKPVPAVHLISLHQVDLGWVAAYEVYGPDYRSTGETTLELWFSPDGGQWRRLDVASLGIDTTPSGAGSFGIVGVDDRLFAVLEDELQTPSRTMWVIDVKPSE